MRLSELIEKLGGELVAGEGSHDITGVASCELAGPVHLIFCEKEEQVAKALASGAGAVVIRGSAESAQGKAVVNAKNPRLWFAKAAKILSAATESDKAEIHPTAVLGEGVRLGVGVSIGAGAVISDGVSIGDGTKINPRVVVYAGTVVGARVVVHSGAVLGADGFGYVRDAESGAYTQFPQQGKLVIEDDVEIGANTTIDRGALGETRIGRGTKIDNMVHIGHNCKIGEDVIIVALTGISGSCTIGRGAVIAGQVGLGDHVTIGEGVILGGQAGVYSGKTLELEGHRPGTVFAGTPAKPLQEHLRELASVARLAKRRGGN
jgi:UDP-3-O-[3-hydroxymyristoyl] glucosamine N-acyltransferase